jgi:hypothetical protein
LDCADSAAVAAPLGHDHDMVVIGVRIEFYDKPARQVGDEPCGFMGAVYREDAFEAVAVPRPGELLAVASLQPPHGPGEDQLFPRFVGAPFLKVQYLEHYPEPVDGEGRPGVIVVVHTTLGYEGDWLRQFVRNYADAGWRWSASDGTELREVWLEQVSV